MSLCCSIQSYVVITFKYNRGTKCPLLACKYFWCLICFQFIISVYYLLL